MFDTSSQTVIFYISVQVQECSYKVAEDAEIVVGDGKENQGDHEASKGMTCLSSFLEIFHLIRYCTIIPGFLVNLVNA